MFLELFFFQLEITNEMNENRDIPLKMKKINGIGKNAIRSSATVRLVSVTHAFYWALTKSNS